MAARRPLVLIALPLLLLALALAGCEGNTTLNAPQGAAWTGITVAGHGEVQAPPDTGYVDVGVQVTEPTVAAARDGAATAASAVIAAIKKDGVADKDIQTTNLSIQPQYDYSKQSSSPTITGYVVNNTVQVTVRDLTKFDKVVDDAATAGGNNVRIQGLRFGIEDTTKILQQARQAAMDDAKARAAQLAKLSGAALGKVQAITESQSTPPTPIYATEKAVAAAAAQPSTPIQTGTNTVTVDVQVRFQLN